MEWDPELACGVELVDNEHKELFKMVDDLLEEGRTPESSEKALGFLSEYVVNHFAHEEALMEECNYPNTEEHKAEHERFVRALGELKRKYENSGGSNKVIIEINQTAIGWLFNHIKVVDQRFSTYYREHMA